MRATQAFFERQGHVFQEVSQQNDFGKDAYVDLTAEGVVSPLCIALQVKSGVSYRRSDGGYALPVGNHRALWRDSTIPIFGMVYDPAEDALFWTDLTRELSLAPEGAGHIVLSRAQCLTGKGARPEVFYAAVARYGRQPARDLAGRLLHPRLEPQLDAVQDAWALARFSADSLIVLRRLLPHLNREAVRLAVWWLSHVGGHPDIFWHAGNWIPEEIQARVRTTFHFSPDELVRLMTCAEREEWTRGALGQCIHVLLVHDPALSDTVMPALEMLLQRHAVGDAVHLLGVAASLFEHPEELLARAVARCPVLSQDELIAMWKYDLAQGNAIDVY